MACNSLVMAYSILEYNNRDYACCSRQLFNWGYSSFSSNLCAVNLFDLFDYYQDEKIGACAPIFHLPQSLC